MTVQSLERDGGSERLWRDVDLSGVTLLLGGGTGQLARLLDEQIARSDGQLVVVDYRTALLEALSQVAFSSHTWLIRARHRQAPVLSESVDLVVVNGILRQVPDDRLASIAEEYWRLLLPGGRLRVSDIVDSKDDASTTAWSERNRLVRKMAHAMGRPTAVSVDLKKAAEALQAAGFKGLKVALMPGYPLSDAWFENTVSSVRTMVARVADAAFREQVLSQDLARLREAYTRGGQRAADRFVIRGTKPGDLALDMEASFSEDDLWSED